VTQTSLTIPEKVSAILASRDQAAIETLAAEVTAVFEHLDRQAASDHERNQYSSRPR
jgi:hypothetical protein